MSLTPRILFLHVPQRRGGEFAVNFMPMGMFSLADLLSREGCRVDISHTLLERLANPEFDLAQLVACEGYDIVCLSLHWHYQMHDVLETVELIKRAAPRVVTVLGGYTATAFASPLLSRHAAVNYVVCGEAEVPLLRLVRALAGGSTHGWQRSVPNLAWRNGCEVVLNPISYVASETELGTFDFANLSLLRQAQLYLRLPEVPLDPLHGPGLPDEMRFMVCTGRGCPVQCFYCGGGSAAQAKLTGRRGFVFRPHAAVVREIRQLLGWGVRHLVFDYDPDPSGRWYSELLVELRSLVDGVSCTWVSWGLPSGSLIDSLSQAGFESVHLVLSPDFGDESLRLCNKGFAFSDAALDSVLADVERRNAAGARIDVVAYCFLGGPGETSVSLRRTATLVRRLRKRRCVRAVLAQVPHAEPMAPLLKLTGQAGVHAHRISFEDFAEFSRCLGRRGAALGTAARMGFSIDGVTSSSLSRLERALAATQRRRSVPEDRREQARRCLDSLERVLRRNPSVYIGDGFRRMHGDLERFACLTDDASVSVLPVSPLAVTVLQLFDGRRTLMDVYRRVEAQLQPIEPGAVLKAFFAVVKQLVLLGALVPTEESNAAGVLARPAHHGR